VSDWEPYEGSARQRRRRRKLQLVALIAALALVLPILWSSIDAIRG